MRPGTQTIDEERQGEALGPRTGKEGGRKLYLESYGCQMGDVTYQSFCENVGWSLGSAFNLLKYGCDHMVRNNIRGSIVNLASIYGVVAPKFEVYSNTDMTMPVEYAANKAGLIHLCKYFAQLYLQNGIRVNVISPGGVFAGQDKNFIAAYNSFCGKIGMLDVGDIVSTLMYLFNTSSRAVTGQNIVVDDGFTL